MTKLSFSKWKKTRRNNLSFVNLEILPVEEEVFEALQVVQVPNPKVVKVNQVKVNQVKASPVAQVPNPKAVKACLVKASLVKAGLVKAIAVANHQSKGGYDKYGKNIFD